MSLIGQHQQFLSSQSVVHHSFLFGCMSVIMLICLGIFGVFFVPNASWQVHQETILICIRCFMGKLLRILTSAMIIFQAQDHSTLLYRKLQTFKQAAFFILEELRITPKQNSSFPHKQHSCK